MKNFSLALILGIHLIAATAEANRDLRMTVSMKSGAITAEMNLASSVFGVGQVTIEPDYFSTESLTDPNPCDQSDACTYERVKITVDPNYCKQSPSGSWSCTELGSLQYPAFISAKMKADDSEPEYRLESNAQRTTKNVKPITVSLVWEETYQSSRSHSRPGEVVPSQKCFLSFSDGNNIERVELYPVLIFGSH